MARPGGEREIIDRIRHQATGGSDDLLVGIGDDCAVYKTSPDRLSLVTTDTMVEGVHFDLAWHPPLALGRKAASVNISDIAAMGGLPRFALLSLALTPACGGQWLDAFMAGFLAVLAEQGVALVGGDTVQSGQGSVLVYHDIAEENGLVVGDRVVLSFPSGGDRRFTVGGIYADDRLLGNWVVSLATYEQLYTEQLDTYILVKGADWSVND